MTDHEQAIINFLRASPESAYSRKEISRKAIRRQEFEENPDWVRAPLAALISRGIVEVDNAGHYKFRKGAHGL